MTSREQDNAWTLSTPVTATWAKPNYSITFHKDGQGQIGKLDFKGPAMVFEGDAEESARVFFDHIAKCFSGRLEAERQAAIQHARDVAVKACEDVRTQADEALPKPNNYFGGRSDGAAQCAAAIKEALK